MEDDYLYNFLVYDNNKNILYSRYNFNFELYKSINNISNKTKNELWKSFIIQNYSLLLLNAKINDLLLPEFEKQYTLLINKYTNKKDYIIMLQKIHTLPYMVHNTMIHYFTNMTPTIEKFIVTYGVFYNENNNNQFNLMPHAMNEINLIQDFIFIDDDNKIYNKYNFDFEKYSIYFKLFSNKLVIFTDFLLRNSFLILTENVELHSFFKEFFIFNSDKDREKKECENSISVDETSEKGYKNIDFILFQLHNNIIDEDIDLTKKKFLTTYQFERKQITFFKNVNKPDLIKESVAMIVLENSYAGFLLDSCDFKNDGNFLITTTKILKSKNDNNFDALFGTTMFTFKIIGYDMLSGILVGHNNTDKINIKGLKIKITSKIKEFENILIINAKTHIRGVVSNIHYNEEINHALLENGLLPETIVIDSHNYNNIIGSPIIINDDNLNDMCCVSMIIDTIPKITSTQPYMLYNVIDYIISEFKETSKIITAYPKAWLGIKSHYFNMSTEKYDNISYIGGIVIDDFAIGYNNTTKKIIYAHTQSTNTCHDNITNLDGILLNSKIYLRKLPIIIKSITMFNNITGCYEKIYFGKYKNQQSYTFFTYGLFPKFNQKINIEYIYLSHNVWIEDNEYIGGEFEYPSILWNYNVEHVVPMINDISLLLSETTLNNKEYSITLNISKPSFSFSSNKSSLSGPYNNFYLPEYAYYHNQNKFETFSEAIVAAYALKCGGITYEPHCKKFTLRISNSLCHSRMEETSFLIISNNAKHCEIESGFMTKQQLLDKALETSASKCKSITLPCHSKKRHTERNKIHTFFEELYKPKDSKI